MFKSFSSLAARLTKYVSGFSSATRRQIIVPVSISLDLEDNKVQKLHQTATKALSVVGQTQDLSKDVIAFVVPFIRLGDYHLVGHGGDQKRLKLVLELPNGRVRVTVLAKQFQMIEIHSSVQNYLIEAEIISIYKGDIERYANFLQYGEKAVSIKKNSVLQITPHVDKQSLLKHL